MPKNSSIKKLVIAWLLVGTTTAMQQTPVRQSNSTIRRALTIAGNGVLCALYANGTYEFAHALCDAALLGAHPAYIAGTLAGMGYMVFILMQRNHVTWRACERAIRSNPLARVSLPFSIVKDVIDWYAGCNVLTGDQTPERYDTYAGIGALRSTAGCSRLVFLLSQLSHEV